MTVGLVLAAGEGRRMGGPKALLRDESGTPWVVRTVRVLQHGGVADVVVVVGAAADEVRAALLAAVPPDHGVRVVAADDWAEGMGASLRTGLASLASTAHDTVLVSLVDLPDVDAGVVGRLVGTATGAGDLARAAYDGVPGHPVLIGRDHWAGVVASATGDRGARDYLAAHEVALVECGDLATGADVDSR